MDLFHHILRTQQIRFPGSGRSTANIHSTHRPFGRDEYRTAGSSLFICEMSRPKAGQIRKTGFFEHDPSLEIDNSAIVGGLVGAGTVHPSK